MAKRFTDTDIFKKPFFRGLQGPYKLLWKYLYHSCDHAGIWIVDFEIAQIYLGQDMPVDKQKALEYFNKDEQRIIEICDGKKWFIPSFIEFQYGELKENNRAHLSVIRKLKEIEQKTIKPLTSPLQGVKDKDKDKDKDKEKDKDKDKGDNFQKEKAIFDIAREKYREVGGVVRGLDIEFDYFRKQHKNWRQILPELLPSIERQDKERKAIKEAGDFVAQWKHFKSWIYNGYWTLEHGIPKQSKDFKPAENQDKQFETVYGRWIQQASIEEMTGNKKFVDRLNYDGEFKQWALNKNKNVKEILNVE